jgi:predicted nucleic acid-binding protein
MAVARYLADKSALARLRHPAVESALGPLIQNGLVATCGVVELEVLWSTRSADEYDEVRADRMVGYEWLTAEDDDWRRAIDVQAELWRRGQARTVPLPDLLIAAIAERHRITVLHYDDDYDRIAAVTAQPTQWVVPRGSVP